MNPLRVSRMQESSEFSMSMCSTGIEEAKNELKIFCLALKWDYLSVYFVSGSFNSMLERSKQIVLSRRSSQTTRLHFKLSKKMLTYSWFVSLHEVHSLKLILFIPDCEFEAFKTLESEASNFEAQTFCELPETRTAKLNGVKETFCFFWICLKTFKILLNGRFKWLSAPWYSTISEAEVSKILTCTTCKSTQSTVHNKPVKLFKHRPQLCESANWIKSYSSLDFKILKCFKLYLSSKLNNVQWKLLVISLDQPHQRSVWLQLGISLTNVFESFNLKASSSNRHSLFRPQIYLK